MPGPQLQHAAPGAPRVGARLRRRLPPAIKNTTNAKRKRSLRCNGSPPRLKATFRKVPCQIQGALRAEFPIALSVGANAKNQASQSSPPEAWSTESGCNSWQKGGQSTTRQATFKTSKHIELVPHFTRHRTGVRTSNRLQQPTVYPPNPKRGQGCYGYHSTH